MARRGTGQQPSMACRGTGQQPSMVRHGCGRRSKVRPILAADREGTRRLNLTVLRRLDPAVSDILITAASVTAYSFDQDTVRWSRKGVEGSLFVVKRNNQPRFQFLIMNRRNTENLVEDLLGDFEYQVEVPYIIYSNAANEIIGIWFYDPEECEEVARLFNRIHKAYSRASPKKMVPSVKSFSDFEELEVASAALSSEEDSLEEPTASSAMVPSGVGYNLLSALITAAACVGAPTGGAGPVQPNQPMRVVPSSRHASPAPSAVSSQPPASHNLPPRTSSATVVPPDAHVPTSTPTIQPASLTKPSFFPPIPITSSQATTADAAFPSSTPPPFLLPLVIQHRQSAPFLQPFPLPSAPPPFDLQHRQSAPFVQPFTQSTAPPPLEPQQRQGAPFVQPFTQSTAPPPLEPQQRQGAPFVQPFTQSTAPPPLDPQHRQSASLLQPSQLPAVVPPQGRQSAPLLQPLQLSSAPPPPRPQQHWQRSPSLQHYALPAECPPPPYGALLLQPFPPPNPPPPQLAPTASYGPVVLSRDKLRGVLLKLVQNDDFIDMFYQEIVKG